MDFEVSAAEQPCGGLSDDEGAEVIADAVARKRRLAQQFLDGNAVGRARRSNQPFHLRLVVGLDCASSWPYVWRIASAASRAASLLAASSTRSL
jgi:hypothetical protein